MAAGAALLVVLALVVAAASGGGGKQPFEFPATSQLRVAPAGAPADQQIDRLEQIVRAVQQR